ncbi:hypothetical protein FACS189493_0870 [Spirochaetia bacterium]|nr:hypothetical protein FACS189493_0870 [Spirochaetia bacterium]
MKRSITIEIDDRAPEIEICGEHCKFLGKNGNCLLFNIELEDHSEHRITGDGKGKMSIEKPQELVGWRRHKQCIDVFYAYGKSETV